MEAYCCLTFIAVISLSRQQQSERTTSENVLPRVLRYLKRNFQKSSHVQKDGALDEALFSDKRGFTTIDSVIVSRGCVIRSPTADAFHLTWDKCHFWMALSP